MRSAPSWTSRLGALLLLLALTGPSAAEVERWSLLGLFGASVDVIAIDPLTPPYVLVYSESDGLYRLAENGESWTRLDFDASHICSLAAAPGVFFLTTWDPDIWSYTMLRSTDGGASWTATPLDNNPCGYEIVAIDPRDLDTLYGISFEQGGERESAARSTDGGETWTEITAELELGGSLDVKLLEMDPSEPARLFLGVNQRTSAGEKFRLLVSQDRGETWSDASQGLPLEPPRGSALAIDPSAPSTVYLALPSDGVFRSTDGGASWQILPGSPTARISPMTLIVVPSRSSTLYLAMRISGIFRSTDGGESWTRLAAAVPLLADWADPRPTVEVLQLTIDSATPSNLYLGTDFGVRRSADGGDSWSQLNDGFIGYWTDSLGVGAQDPARLYAASRRINGILGSRDRGASWEMLARFTMSRSFRKLVVDPEDSSIVYLMSPGGYYGGGVLQSTDGGQSWTQRVFDNRFVHVSDLAIDPLDPRFVYVSWRDVILKSSDRGASWESLETGGIYSGLLAVDPTTSDLYLGTGSAVYRSRDGAHSWSLVAAGLTESYITSLAIAPSKPDVLYAGAGDGVFRSEDRGASWTRTSFPDDLAVPRVLVIDPTDPSILYVPTPMGVYWTSDRGERWKLLAQHSLSAWVYDLALDPSNPHHLYAATRDGIFEIEVFPDRTTLELRDGRFQVEVEWTDFHGDVGPGTVAVVPSQTSGVTELTSPDSTVVEFFDPGNWELLIKVLDGTAINGHFWVFFAAATDVGYTTTVTDTGCGAVKTYINPLGLAAPAVTDEKAFPGCDSPAPPSCVEDGAILCLGEDGRFRVEIQWTDFLGNSGLARQVRLARPGLAQSEDSGLFYFFSPDNWELLVKVLDGCELNDRYWVFAAATTDVGYTLRITDTAAGIERTYSNPVGVSAAAITDAGAFATCNDR